MQIWTGKYKPKNIKEIEGQEKVIERVNSYINNYINEKKKALILYGPTGCGKTSIVYAIANELNCEIVEINASDYRNADEIEKKIGNALKQYSLFYKSKIILIDEVDGLSGTKDRGGMSMLAKIIEKSPFPILCTTQNPYEEKLSTLRKKCELIELNTLSYLSVFSVLKRICINEKVEYEELSLKGLARRSGGDLRAAINDLQMLSINNEFKTKELEELSQRDHQDTIHQALMKVFKTTDANVSRDAFNNIPEDIDKIMLWIDENLPKEYKNPQDLARAYNMISRADVFKGRIRRWQYWRFLVYINDLLSSGISVSKDEKNKEFIKYTPTTRILAIWRANMKYSKRKQIAEKIAKKTHTSKKRVIESTLPYFQQVYKNKSKNKNKLSEEFEFDKDEIDYLSK
jgi:replication factor C large subunit